MIRNGGKITKVLDKTNNSPVNGASGVYDTLDAYTARTGNTWPITVNYSKSISALTTMFEASEYTIINTSESLQTNTELYYTIENISGNAAGLLTTGLSGSFTQIAANQSGSFNIIFATTLDPMRQPYTFKINIRQGGVAGPIVNSSDVITLATPIPQVYFSSNSITPVTTTSELGSGSGYYYYINMNWGNTVGTARNSDYVEYYYITWSGTATAADTIDLPANIYSNGITAFGGASPGFYIAKDFLTEGTESLIATVRDSTNRLLGTTTLSILDTSTTPVTTITNTKTTVVEGSSVTFTVSVQNSDPNNNIFWVIVGSAASKFAVTSGTISNTSNGTLTLTPINNFVYGEINTTFQVQFRAGSSTNYLYGTSEIITVTDPPSPTGTITGPASINEGVNAQFVVNTTDFTGGTLTWAITKLTGTLTVTDFFTALSGTIIQTNDTSTIYVNPRSDLYTEGSETFKLEVKLLSGVVLASTNFTINDTSTGTTEATDLYSFSSFTFLPGQTSTTGTSALNYTGDTLTTFVNSIYNKTTYPWLTNTSYYNVVTAGIQQWTVPFTGIYRITVAGGQGGNWFTLTSGSGYGGGGAWFQGDVLLTKGTVLNIVVGKAGGNAGTTAVGGGGAGGTFVYTGAIGGTGLLFAAGGGGGADDSAVNGQDARYDFYAGTNNAAARTNPTDGNGAPAGGAGGGSGCGWLSDSTGTGFGARFTGGLSFSPGGVGGFGGGGGDQDDGGGGGGYTGGTSTTSTSGGCGGSYVSTANGSVVNYTWLGINKNTSSSVSAQGFVSIIAQTNGVTATVTPSASTIIEGQSVTFNIVTTNYVSGNVYYTVITNSGILTNNDFSQTTNAIAIVNSVGQVSFIFNNDNFTEGTETFSLLIYYNSGGFKYPLATSSVVTVQDTSTGTTEQVPYPFNIIQNGYVGTGQYTYEVVTPISSVYFLGESQARGWTVLQNVTLDDGFVTVPLPFNFVIDGTSYTTAYVGSNAYINFGAGSVIHNLGASSAASTIPYPKLVWSGGDNSMQRCYYRVDPQNKFILIRYEGNGSTSGTLGSPGIVAEIKLYNSQFTGGLSVIEIKFNTNRTVSATSHPLTLSNANSYYQTVNFASNNVQYNYVFYATNVNATTWGYIGGNYNSGYVVVV